VNVGGSSEAVRAQNAFRQSLNLLSSRGISWQMNNITTFAGLKNLINASMASPIIVFNNTVPIPSPYNASFWTLTLAGMLGRTQGIVAFFTNGTYAMNGVTEWDRLLNYTVGFCGASPTLQSSSESYANPEVTSICNFFGQYESNYQFETSSYATIDNIFWNSLSGVIGYREIYDYYNNPVVYRIGNPVSELFYSPFSNNTVNGMLLFGDLIYGFEQSYNQIMTTLLSMGSSWSTTIYNQMKTDWNNKNFVALTTDLVNIESYEQNMVSNESLNTIPIIVNSSLSIANGTDNTMTSFNTNMQTANKTWTGLTLTDAEAYYGVTVKKTATTVTVTQTSKGSSSSTPSFTYTINLPSIQTSVSYEDTLLSLLGSNINLNGQNFNGIMGYLKSSMKNIGSLNNTIFLAVMKVFNTTVQNFIASGATQLGQGIIGMSGLNALVNGFSSWFNSLGNTVQGGMKLLIGTGLLSIQNIIKSIMGTLVSTIQSVMMYLESIISVLTQDVVNVLTSVANVLNQVLLTITNMFIQIGQGLNSLSVYLNSSFTSIKDWSIGSVTLVQNSINGVIGEAQSLATQLEGASGFYSIISPLQIVLENVISSNQYVKYALGAFGLTTNLFEEQVTAENGLSQTMGALHGYNMLMFGSDPNGINLSNITFYANYNGTPYTGSSRYEVDSLTSGTIQTGVISFVKGVGVLNLGSLNYGVYSVNCTINPNTNILSYIDKSNSFALQNGVFGSYQVVIPNSTTTNAAFNIIVTLNNERYSSGTAIVTLTIYDGQYNYVAWFGIQDVSFSGSGSKTVIFSPSIWLLGEDGEYPISISVTDSYTNSQWQGVTSSFIKVYGISIFTIISIIAVVALPIVLIVVILLILRKMGLISRAVGQIKVNQQRKVIVR
jgi:hypothetical protein